MKAGWMQKKNKKWQRRSNRKIGGETSTKRVSHRQSSPCWRLLVRNSLTPSWTAMWLGWREIPLQWEQREQSGHGYKPGSGNEQTAYTPIGRCRFLPSGFEPRDMYWTAVAQTPLPSKVTMASASAACRKRYWAMASAGQCSFIPSRSPDVHKPMRFGHNQKNNNQTSSGHRSKMILVHYQRLKNTWVWQTPQLFKFLRNRADFLWS